MRLVIAHGQIYLDIEPFVTAVIDRWICHNRFSGLSLVLCHD
jgi:hypothetical protein